MSMKLPLRHLSIRVPWHDNGWNGTVCADPVNNSSCLRLGNIHERRDDGVEVDLRGSRMDELTRFKQPPCVAERSTFMADFRSLGGPSILIVGNHPSTIISCRHQSNSRLIPLVRCRFDGCCGIMP